MLRVNAFAEADRLIRVFSLERGKLRLVAKGARRLHSRLAGGLQPYTRVQLLCWRGRSLDGVSQAQVLDAWRSLRETLIGAAAAAYLCELVIAVAPEDDRNPRLYRLLSTALSRLDQALEENGDGKEAAGRARWLVCAFVWKLLNVSGFAPVLDACSICERPLPAAARSVRVAIQEGGIVCRDHPSVRGPLLVVPAGVARLGRELIRQPWTRIDAATAIDDRIFPLLQLGRAFLTSHLERPLRSEAWLDEVLATYG